MIEYRMMDATCPLPTCLHGGPIPLDQCRASSDTLAYVETVSSIPRGSVARALVQLSERYGACGVLAIEDGMVVGKIRCYPREVIETITYPCVQWDQRALALIELAENGLPTVGDARELHLYCMQVSPGYRGRGIAGGMLDTLIAWSRQAGWRSLRARAMQHIPPLMNWSGQLSVRALERRGFVIVSERVHPEMREGVVSQRGGHHGEDVLRQWEDFAHLSDDEAAKVFEMSLAWS